MMQQTKKITLNLLFSFRFAMLMNRTIHKENVKMAKDSNLFQQGLYVGLGLAHRTKERIESYAKKVSEEYDMNKEEGQNFVEDIVKEADETHTRLDDIVEKRLEMYLKEANIPQKQDIDKLSKKIDELEKKL